MARYAFLWIPVVLAFLLATPLWGAEEGTPASLAEALEALRGFERAYRTRDVARREAALDIVGRIDHPKVASRLGRLLKREKAPGAQAALFRALSAQSAPGERVMKKVAKWLVAEAKEERNRIRRVMPQVRVDPRTGEVDVTSEDGRLRLETTRARSLVLREAMLCVRLFFREPPKEAHELGVLLQDPHDGLVIETLRAFGAWRLEAALPDVHALFQMYPTERSWDTSHVLTRAGNDRIAKGIWLVQFGHPGKQRTRPEVVDAIHTCLQAVTGRRFETPAQVEAWIRDPKRKRSAA